MHVYFSERSDLWEESTNVRSCRRSDYLLPCASTDTSTPNPSEQWRALIPPQWLHLCSKPTRNAVRAKPESPNIYSPGRTGWSCTSGSVMAWYQDRVRNGGTKRGRKYKIICPDVSWCPSESGQRLSSRLQ